MNPLIIRDPDQPADSQLIFSQRVKRSRFQISAAVRLHFSFQALFILEFQQKQTVRLKRIPMIQAHKRIKRGIQSHLHVPAAPGRPGRLKKPSCQSTDTCQYKAQKHCDTALCRSWHYLLFQSLKPVPAHDSSSEY